MEGYLSFSDNSDGGTGDEDDQKCWNDRKMSTVAARGDGCRHRNK